MKITIQSSSLKGIRESNQDYCSFLLNKNNDFISIICDGIGSLKFSHEASKIVCETFISKFNDILLFSNVHDWFRETLKICHTSIIQYAKNNLLNKPIGTTMSLLILKNKQFYIFNIGDSRIFGYTNRKLTLLTCDHNFLNYLKEKNASSSVIEANKLKWNLLTSYIGNDLEYEKIIYQHKTYSLNDFSAFILATDGLYNYVSQADLLNTIELNESNKSTLLNNKAVLSKSDDNISNIIINIDK